MKTRLSRRLTIAVAASLTLSLLALAKNGYIFPKKAGSFEYVRQGELFLDKGDYSAAIRLFEKAHDQSPENRVIARDLIYAYSMRASQFADNGRYDEAVAYMARARDVMQNAYTMQNLALTYAKKALDEAAKEDWAKALDSFEHARFAAGDSALASKNLGISLYNDAAGQFKAGRDRLATLLLKQAVLVYEDSRIFAFLGDIYYKLSDLDTALFYYTKARALSPQNKDIADHARIVASELELSQQKTVSQAPHFEVRSEAGMPFDAQYAAGVLEKAYTDVGRDLGYFPPSKTVVSFYSKKNFEEIFRLPSIVRAFYDGTMRVPMPETAVDTKELTSYLYHEYTHAVLSAMTKDNCPPWLGEGIAVWEEVRWTRSGSVEAVPERALSGRDLSVQALSDVFKEKSAEKADIQLYYILAYTLVDYVTDTWGVAGLRGVLKRIAGGRHAVNAIDEEFLVSEKEFDARWNKFVMKKYVKAQ